MGIGSQGGGPYTQYATGATSTSRFAFSNAVQSLAFTILDIDASTGGGDGYRDIVELDWLPATTTVTTTPVSGSPTFTTSIPNRRWQANANAAATSVTGNLRVTFNGPITEFTIRFIAGVPPTNGPARSKTTQIIGLSNLDLCA